VWIAATALHVAARLITFDRDFERIADLDATVLSNGPRRRVSRAGP
jgi:predicted nucleic acid-binding protein